MTTIVGHDATIAAFLSAMRGDRPHHGWLFAGDEGVGKASLAMSAARRLLAEAADPNLTGESLHLREDHPTAALMDAWSHPDFILIDRLPKDPKVAEKPRADWPEGEERRRSIVADQVRDLNRRFSTHPTYSTRRIVVIDGAESMEVVAANALLKMLEEPPAGTIFILVTHAPGRLLPTIRSRCRMLRFSGLADDVMTSILGAEIGTANAAEIAALVSLGQGAPGRAIRQAGLGIDKIIASLDQIAATGDRDNVVRLALANSMSTKSSQVRFEALLGLAPAYLATQARKRHGKALSEALRGWEGVRDLAQHAVLGSLDPQAVTLQLASHVAALAPKA